MVDAPKRSGGASKGASGGTRTPRVVVVRGTRNANVLELGIYAELAKHGFEPSLLGARSTNYRDDEVGMPVRRLPTPALLGSMSRTMAGGFLLGKVSPYRYFHEYLQRFDRAAEGAEILCPVDLGHPTSFQCLGHRPRSKVVVQCWDNIPFNWPEDRPLAAHYRAVLERADFFLPFSKDADRTLRLQGVEASRRAQIYPGLDARKYRPPTPEERAEARIKFRAKPQDIVVSFVGRVEFGKGIFTLLESIADADARLLLRVYGDGSQLARARGRAKNLGLEERVSFLGPVSHDRLLPDALWGSDVLCVPSIPTEQWREQFGQIYIEAGAVGLPVVASRTGATPEVVQDGLTGLLVPPDAPDDLRLALEGLAADVGLRTRLGESGRALVKERFNVQQNGSQLAQILHEHVLAG